MRVHAGASLQCVYVTALTEAEGDADDMAASPSAGWPCLQYSAMAHRVSRIWHEECGLQTVCVNADSNSVFETRVLIYFHGF